MIYTDAIDGWVVVTVIFSALSSFNGVTSPKLISLTAYVGCGFSSGVHNVLEPALQGCYVSYGPNISLLDEAIELKDKKLIKIIYNSDDFKDFIKIDDIKFLDTNKSKIDKLFENKKRDFEKMREIIYE